MHGVGPLLTGTVNVLLYVFAGYEMLVESAQIDGAPTDNMTPSNYYFMINYDIILLYVCFCSAILELSGECPN